MSLPTVSTPGVLLFDVNQTLLDLTEVHDSDDRVLLQVRPADCMLVAAHPWDVAGAAWAGMRTASLARLGARVLPIATTPEIEGLDLNDLVTRLGATGETSVIDHFNKFVRMYSLFRPN